MEENKNILEEQSETQKAEVPEFDPEKYLSDTSEPDVAEATAEAESTPAPEQPKKKKKLGVLFGILGGVAALIIALVLIFTLKDNKNLTRNKFINEIGGVSETFIGAVSKEYPTSTDAAEGFVEKEVVGYSYATITSVDSKGPAQSSEHKIPAEFLEGSEMVEKFEVEFTVPTEASLKREVQLLSSSNEGEKKAKVVVYVIKYETNWKYFAPLPVTGDTISKSYYDSVFDNSKYQNCTYEFFQTTKSGTLGITAGEHTLHQIYKFQDGKIYIEQTQTTKELGTTTTETLYFYAEEHDNGYVECYIKENGGMWQEAELRNIGFYRIEELTPFYNQYLDYTYFTKTDYGFDLPKENAAKYFSESLIDALRGENIIASEEDLDVNMYAEYFVREGVLSGMRINADAKMKVETDGLKVNVNMDIEGYAKVTNYGTTVVEKPNVN